jgi:hypothetical protein
MEEQLPSNPVAWSSVIERTVRWTPDDTYSQVIRKKPEYSGRVRRVGKNVRPVSGTIYS